MTDPLGLRPENRPVPTVDVIIRLGDGIVLVRLGRQFHTYSDPARDPRRHTISTVFLADADGVPRGGDDAAEARVFPARELPPLAFDHAQIIADYLAGRH